jgi:hypothetical protein
MSADTLIRRALDAGVELSFVDGKLKVTGKRSAVESWTPRLRQYKAELIEALRPPEPEIDWRPLAQAYHQHHFSCPTCCAAGRGVGLRCGTGTSLWSAYQQTNDNDPIQLKKAKP